MRGCPFLVRPRKGAIVEMASLAASSLSEQLGVCPTFYENQSSLCVVVFDCSFNLHFPSD